MATTYSVKNAYQSPTERLGVLNTSAITFTKSRATQAAASLAYYTFFSIFPLMLVFILAGSYFLDRQSVLQRVTEAVQSVLPISQQFIVQNLQQVLKQRTAVGVLVLVSLLWSASNMFNNLAHEINMAWPEAKDRNFWQARLIGLDMIAGLTGLLILSVVLDSLTKWLAGMNGVSSPFAVWNPLTVLSSLGSWIAIFLLYLGLYRWVPTVRVAWSASFWGALVAAIGWKAATTGFAWYLGSPFAHYQLVYGSLGAIVAFLFLIYSISMVTLFGAHMTAAVDHLHRRRMARRLKAIVHASNARPETEAGKSGRAPPSDEVEPKRERKAIASPEASAGEVTPRESEQPQKAPEEEPGELSPSAPTKYPKESDPEDPQV